MSRNCLINVYPATKDVEPGIPTAHHHVYQILFWIQIQIILPLWAIDSESSLTDSFFASEAQGPGDKLADIVRAWGYWRWPVKAQGSGFSSLRQNNLTSFEGRLNPASFPGVNTTLTKKIRFFTIVEQGKLTWQKSNSPAIEVDILGGTFIAVNVGRVIRNCYVKIRSRWNLVQKEYKGHVFFLFEHRRFEWSMVNSILTHKLE